MRLPTNQVYRAFAELDRFTDEQCRGYVRRSIAKHVPSMFLAGLGAAMLAVILAVTGFFIVYAMSDLIMRASGPEGQLGLLFMAVAIVIPIMLAMLAGLLVRDRWLRWAIGRELLRSTCPGCEYQLLGLPVANGEVRCPECSMSTRLDLLNLQAADLDMSGGVQVGPLKTAAPNPATTAPKT